MLQHPGEEISADYIQKSPVTGAAELFIRFVQAYQSPLACLDCFPDLFIAIIVFHYYTSLASVHSLEILCQG